MYRLNLFGEPLKTCSNSPLTGFFRDGCCTTSNEDTGSHTVCVIVTQSFLEYSFSRGNDLITPRPEYGFEGLKEGDKWCVCAARWLEAFKAEKAPFIDPEATNEKAAEIIPMDLLIKFSLKSTT